VSRTVERFSPLRWVLLAVVLLTAAMVAIAGASPASAAPAAYTYDTTPYAYDVPVRLSLLHETVAGARGPRAEPTAVPWGSSVSVPPGVATNTAADGMAGVRTAGAAGE
jgi:hypothetical protein